MKFIELLNKNLKDEKIIDLLEDSETEVIYDFDRLHENEPDRYWAEFKSKGILLRFDETQHLFSIFLYVTSHDGFEGIDLRIVEDIPIIKDIGQIEKYGEKHKFRISKGEKPKNMLPEGNWIRLDDDQVGIHFEFIENELSMITITRNRS
jgi:hypothetical protein